MSEVNYYLTPVPAEFETQLAPAIDAFGPRDFMRTIEERLQEGNPQLYEAMLDFAEDVCPGDPFDSASNEQQTLEQQTALMLGAVLGHEALLRAAQAEGSSVPVVDQVTCDVARKMHEDLVERQESNPHTEQVLHRHNPHYLGAVRAIFQLLDMPEQPPVESRMMTTGAIRVHELLHLEAQFERYTSS